MTPVWMFEGSRQLDATARRNLAERRFAALAAAVQAHEAAVRRRSGGLRPQDAMLYRRLRQLCGDAGAADAG